MKKLSGFTMLLVLCLLFSFAPAAFGACPDNGIPFAGMTEDKIFSGEEVAISVDCENVADVQSVESIQCEIILLSVYNRIGDGSQDRKYNYVTETGLARLPPEGKTA